MSTNRPGQTLRFRPQCEPLETRTNPAVITVNTQQDGIVFGVNLRTAIAAAETFAGPDVIVFDPTKFDANGNFTIRLDSPLPQIKEDGLVINGFAPGMNRPTIQPSANVPNGFRLFDVAFPLAKKGRAVVFENLVISGGFTPDGGDPNGAAIKAVNADLTVKDSILSGNHAKGDGGAIWATGDQCLVDLDHTTVSHNWAEGNGGGVATKNIYTLLEEGTRVEDNTALLALQR